MVDVLTFRNIRIDSKYSRTAFNRRLIERKDLCMHNKDFIVINNAVYNYALRLNRIFPISVQNGSEWVLVNQMDIKALEKLYSTEETIIEKEEVVVEQPIEIEENHEEETVAETAVEESTEIAENVESIDEEATESENEVEEESSEEETTVEENTTNNQQNNYYGKKKKHRR